MLSIHMEIFQSTTAFQRRTGFVSDDARAGPYTRALLDKCAQFPPTGFGEDYALVVDAADAGAACAAFVDSTADPVCLHVLHGHSSSRTYAGRRVMGADEVAARYGPEIVALTGEDPGAVGAAIRERRAARDRDRERRLARRRRGASSSSSDDDDGDP